MTEKYDLAKRALVKVVGLDDNEANTMTGMRTNINCLG
jgi:hypothetical protein